MVQWDTLEARGWWEYWYQIWEKCVIIMWRVGRWWVKLGDLIRFISPLSGERIGVIIEFDENDNPIAFTTDESVFDRDDKTHWVSRDEAEVINESR